ncbi:MAG: hypothetical protein U0L75_00090, partial [Ruminococcus sp.]|nr:hypothetical protein [Ruminococcus sp.]
MDNNFNNDNVQPNQVPNPEQTPQGKDYSAQFAQYNQPRNGFDNQNTDANPYQQPAQPDYNQYQPQQPAQPDYNQYQPQQPAQPDYNQYQPQQPVQPDYNQYQPQQPVQPDYNQYQPQQPDYNQYQNNAVQPFDYNQAGYQQPEYQQGNVYNPDPVDGPTGAAKAFSIVSLVCGIVSIVLGCCGFGFFAGIPGAVFGIISKSKCPNKNALALVGMILSFVGIGIS